MTETDTAHNLVAPAPIPAWLSVIIIILCLGGGGWMMHWYIKTDSLSNETKMVDPKLVQASPVATPRAGRGEPGPGRGCTAGDSPAGRQLVVGA